MCYDQPLYRPTLSSECLGGRVLLLRVLQRWRAAAAECGQERAQGLAADAFRERRLTARWLSAWRQGAARERLVQNRAAQRARRVLAGAWAAWREVHQRLLLVGALTAAARLRSDAFLLRQCFSGWREVAAAWHQVELPHDHPVMRRAALMQRQWLLRSAFGAWRAHIQAEAAPRARAVQLLVTQCLMGAQAAAWALWRRYVEQRRRKHLLSQVADQHVQARAFERWRQGAATEQQERAEAHRGALCHQVLLLRCVWRAWSTALELARRKSELLAAAEMHWRAVQLARGWEAWSRWLSLCRMSRQQQDVLRAANALHNWREVVHAARAKQRANAHHQARARRAFASAFCAWRQRVRDKQLARQRLMHASRLLERRALGRSLAAWRLGALASKLASSLGMAQELQAAVTRVRDELQGKAAEVS